MRIIIDMINFFSNSDWTKSWWIFGRPAACAGSCFAAHLVRAGRVQGSLSCRAAPQNARVRSEESADPDLPRGHLHQQHIGHAVQEGQLRGWRRHLSDCCEVSIICIFFFNFRLLPIVKDNRVVESEKVKRDIYIYSDLYTSPVTAHAHSLTLLINRSAIPDTTRVSAIHSGTAPSTR